MKYGYARENAEQQGADRQLDALREYGVDEIFEDKISGTDRNRPQLNLLMSKLRAGDALVIYELKQLGRNTRQLIVLVEELKKNGVQFVSLMEEIDTATPTGRFVLTIWRDMTRLDGEIQSEIVKTRNKAVRPRGGSRGRPFLEREKTDRALKMYLSSDYTIGEIAEATGVSKGSIYNYVKGYRDEERNRDDGSTE